MPPLGNAHAQPPRSPRVDDLAGVAPLPPRPTDAPVLDTGLSRVYALPPGAPAPPGADATLALPDATRVAYVLAGEGAPTELLVDPFVRGNAFQPLHASARAQSALVSLAAGRRLDMGPESERVLVFLRGRGLLSLDNGDVHRFEPHHVGFVRAGEAARLWAQGPEDVLAVVFQPRGGRQEKRTLASEIARRRSEAP